MLKHYMKYAYLVLLPHLTLAASGDGGLPREATNMITTVRSAIIAVVGVVATIALLWQFAQGFMGRKTWGDIFETCLWILGAGAAVSIATWIFTKGSEIKF